jgi:hypothetical protein
MRITPGLLDLAIVWIRNFSSFLASFIVVVVASSLVIVACLAINLVVMVPFLATMIISYVVVGMS